MSVLDDVDFLVLQSGSHTAKRAGTRIKFYIYIVTILMITFLILWVSK